MKLMKTIIIILIVIVILIGGLIFILNKNAQNEQYIETPNTLEPITIPIKQVDNPTMFFTVESCVNKYIGYLRNKEEDIIFNLLDENYKKEFSITRENLWQYVEQLNNNYIFSAEDMHYETNGNIEKYYVTGNIEEDTFSDEMAGANIKEFNITVILDMSNNTFSIIPYGYGGMYYEENA